MPLDVALYFDIAELHNELEFEEKILLSKQAGPFNFITNLWVEQEVVLGPPAPRPRDVLKGRSAAHAFVASNPMRGKCTKTVPARSS